VIRPAFGISLAAEKTNQTEPIGSVKNYKLITQKFKDGDEKEFPFKSLKARDFPVVYTDSINLTGTPDTSLDKESCKDAPGRANFISYGKSIAANVQSQWSLPYGGKKNGWAALQPTAEQQVRERLVARWTGDRLPHHARGGSAGLLVVSADGMRTETVTATPAEEQHSAWGPEGNSIIYDLSTSSDPTNQLYLVRRSHRGAPWGVPRRLTTDGSSDPKWSPDGRLIAYTAHGELRVIAPDGTGQRVVVSTSKAAALPTPSYPIWSRDSRTIYYKAYDAQLATSIWAVSRERGQPRLLVTFDDPSRRSLRREFATDGRRFYFTIANNDSDLWAMQLTSK